MQKKHMVVNVDPAGSFGNGSGRELVSYIWAKHPDGTPYNLSEVNKNSEELYIGNVDSVVNKHYNFIKVRNDFNWILQVNGKLRKSDFSKFWVRFDQY